MNQPSPARERARSTPLRLLDEIASDVRFGARGLRRNLGFAVLAALVLSLAIGANAAIFALVDGLLLRPVGIAEPGRLVRVFARNTAEPDVYRSFSYPNYVDLRDGATVFEDVAAFTPALIGLDRGDGTMQRVFAQIVTASYFSTLGAEPAIGRVFTPEEDKPNAEIRVAVVSHSFWARSGADPAFLGTTIDVNGEAYTVVGVAPEGFAGISALLTTDLWLPLGVHGTSAGQFMASSRGDLSDRDRHELMVIARLRDGLVAEDALSQLQVLAARMAADSPDVNRDHVFTLAPQPRFTLSSRPSSDTAATTGSLVLMAMAGIVLLVACLNLANMFLAQGSARSTEIAIRQSLGGGRRRILRQLLTEGFLVSLAGGAGGLLLGVWAARWVVTSIAPVLPFGSFALDIGLDARAVVATLLLCVLSTALFGLGPSLALVRSAVLDDLKDGGARLTRHARAARVSAPEGKRRAPKRSRRPRQALVPRNTLVVAQIALSLALVTAAGLFVRSAQRAASYETEFEVEGLLLVEMDAALGSLEEERALALYRRVLERLREEPGVAAAALASNVPFSSIAEGDGVSLAGSPDENEEVDAETYVVTAGYFETMGLPILRGRDFAGGEAEAGAAPAGRESLAAVIVDEPLARRLAPDGDVVGRALSIDTPREEQAIRVAEIVGVVPAVRRQLFDQEAKPTLYLPFGANYRPRMIAHLRVDRGGDGAASAVLESAGRGIRAIDPRLPILSMKTLEAHLEQGIERWAVRTGATVFGAMGVVAVLLALVGVYGVKSYLVSRRTREIGIRMALGATPRDVSRWMLRDGLVSTVSGVAIGIVLAIGIGRVLSSALYGVGGFDPVTFVAAPLLLAGAALLAAYLPSRRATRLAPSVALRQD